MYLVASFLSVCPFVPEQGVAFICVSVIMGLMRIISRMRPISFYFSIRSFKRKKGIVQDIYAVLPNQCVKAV